MKKIISILASVCCCLIFGLMLVGCGDDAIAVEKIELDKNEVTLASGASADVAYSVTPADGDVVFEIISESKSSERVFTYTTSEGTIKIQAVSAGEETLRIRAKSDKTVYADCKVTVELPSGYTAYRKTDVKFAYPSSWSKFTISGTEVAYTNGTGSSNLNLTSEKKNSAYFSASAETFKTTYENAYKAMGYNVSVQCTVEKYDNGKAVRVNSQYTLSGQSMNQVQLIRNSESKTYVLTLTNMTNDQITIMQNEFYAW